MESSFDVDYEGLKRLSKEFIEAAKILDTLEQLDNAWKCLGIAFLSCKHTDDELGRINREAGAPALMRLMGKVYMQNEIRINALLDEQGAEELKR